MVFWSKEQPKRTFDLTFEYADKNRDYDISPKLLSSAPPTSKIWTSPKVLDQGTEGACAAFSGVGALQCEPNGIVLGYGYDECVKDVYWAAQRIDTFPGGTYPGAKVHMDGTSLNAVARVFKKEGLVRNYRWSFNKNNFRTGIIQHGPAHIGVRMYEGMQRTNLTGWIKPIGECVGGHALVVVGYVAGKTPYYVIQNSWGATWGGWWFKNAGRCRITEKDLFKLLFDERGQAVFYEV